MKKGLFYFFDRNKILRPIIRRVKLAGFALLHIFCSNTTLAHAGIPNMDSLADVVISGKITDENGEPLPGASILEKGTDNGTISDVNGDYQLNVTEGATLIVSFVGYNSREILAAGQTRIDVQMSLDVQQLTEIVVIGYGTENRRDVLGAISSVKEEEIQQRTPVNVFEAIQGQVAGVQINAGSGAPGEGPEIRVRGLSTFSAGVNPLFVVDGQQVDNINNLNPGDIKSIEVLKDGASTAIYGSRSANGVVIITTKSGSVGKPQIQVGYVRTYSQINRTLPVANNRQRVLFEQQRGGNVGTGESGDSLSLQFQNTTNIQEVVLRTAVRDQFNFSIAGSGSEGKTKYYINTAYLNEQGIIINSNYRRLSNQVNLDFKPNDIIEAGTRINLSFELQNGIDEDRVLNEALERAPYFPVFDLDGTLYPTVGGRRNPLASTRLRIDRDRNFRSNLFQYVDAKLLPNLSFRSTIGVTLRFRREDVFEPSLLQANPNEPPTGGERHRIANDWIHENFFTFQKEINDHNINALAGMSVQRERDEDTRFGGVFATDLISTLNALDDVDFNLVDDSDILINSLAAFFGRVKYSYKDKYLFGATFRRDGSSRVGEDRRWGNFPSVSVGWRFSDENFFAGLDRIISEGKFRASIARTGNERIGRFDNTSLFEPGAFYFLPNSNNGINGIRSQTRLGNPDLTWEVTDQLNFGLDLGLFHNKLSLTVDYYEKLTESMLADVEVAPESGFNRIRRNVGSVRNSGIELSLNGIVYDNNDFQWSTSFNIATLRNEVLSLAGDQPFEVNSTWRIEEGEPIGNFFGFKNLGIFTHDESNAFVRLEENGPLVQLTPVFDEDGNFLNYNLNGAPYVDDPNTEVDDIIQLREGTNVLRGGDIIWDDVNGDGQIDVENDRQILGNGLPEFFGGFRNQFRYKGFSFSVLFDYSLGGDIYREYDWDRDNSTSFGPTPSPQRIDGAWVRPGDETIYPTLNRFRSQNRLEVNSFYIEDGSYIRLRNIKFGYELPQKWISKAKLSRANINISVNNLATWTSYSGFDPEVRPRNGAILEIGRDQLRFPTEREWIFGINLQF